MGITHGGGKNFEKGVEEIWSLSRGGSADSIYI